MTQRISAQALEREVKKEKRLHTQREAFVVRKELREQGFNVYLVGSLAMRKFSRHDIDLLMVNGSIDELVEVVKPEKWVKTEVKSFFLKNTALFGGANLDVFFEEGSH